MWDYTDFAIILLIDLGVSCISEHYLPKRGTLRDSGCV